MVLRWTTSYVPIKSVSFPSSRQETYILFVKYFLLKMADVWKVRVRVTATYRVHRSLRYCVTLMSTCYLVCSVYRWFILLCTNSVTTVTLFTPKCILFFQIMWVLSNPINYAWMHMSSAFIYFFFTTINKNTLLWRQVKVKFT